MLFSSAKKNELNAPCNVGREKTVSLQYLSETSGLYHVLPFAIYPSSQAFYLQIHTDYFSHLC